MRSVFYKFFIYFQALLLTRFENNELHSTKAQWSLNGVSGPYRSAVCNVATAADLATLAATPAAIATLTTTVAACNGRNCSQLDLTKVSKAKKILKTKTKAKNTCIENANRSKLFHRLCLTLDLVMLKTWSTPNTKAINNRLILRGIFCLISEMNLVDLSIHIVIDITQVFVYIYIAY